MDALIRRWAFGVLSLPDCYEEVLGQVFVWTFSNSLSLPVSLSDSSALSPSLWDCVGGRGLGLPYPFFLLSQHFMKPLQRFLKPQDIEIIFINIEVS